MKVLGIETSSDSGSVAIVDDDLILGEILLNTGTKHSQKIVHTVEKILQFTDVDRSDIKGISVSVGPGSYTSLRVGISIAKSLAYSLNIPIVGISTLEILAYNLMFPGYICPIIDAKRSELFSAIFKYDNGLVRISEDTIITPEILCKKIKDKTVFIGNGINLYKSIFMDRLQGLVLFAPEGLGLPRASSCGLLSINKFKNNIVDDAASLIPKYLRETDARKIAEKLT